MLMHDWMAQQSRNLHTEKGNWKRILLGAEGNSVCYANFDLAFWCLALFVNQPKSDI